MPVSLSTVAAKDGTGTAVAGGLQAQDKSGTGAGPFTLGHILIDGLAGTNQAAVTASNALKVDGSAVTQPVSGTVTAAQATAANLNATVVGTGTFAVQAAATLNAETTKVIGTVRNVGNVGGVFDFAGQNAAAPANALLIGGEFNTTPTTLTTGNASPLQMDSSGNLLVNIKAGAGSGGTALADEAAFTEGTTSFTPMGGVFKTSQTALTSGQAGAVALSAAREMNTLGKVWDGTNTAGVAPASTAPLATQPALVVAISPNSVNANGRALPSASAPVVLNSMTYSPVAASATATLFGATGATGDYLDGVLIIPATAAAGAVSITDGSGSAITIFAGGGTTALPTLAPFFVPIGAISKNGSGGWKVTTGTNVSVIGVGNFT